MTIGLNATLRTTMAQDYADALDAGGAGATLKIYSGTRPATGAGIGGSILLAQLTFAFPAAVSVASGLVTADAITRDNSANATNTATWYRIEDSMGTHVEDGDITASGGGGDLELVTVSITMGMPVEISSFTFEVENP